MGEMRYFNNLSKRWRLIADSTASSKNRGAQSVCGAGGVHVNNDNNAYTEGFKRTGNLGVVECEVTCSADAQQFEIQDPEEIKFFEDLYGKDTPKKYWKISRFQVYVPAGSVQVATGYALNARVKKVMPKNYGKGKANWGGVHALFDIDWWGITGTETITGSAQAYMTASKLEIKIRI